MKPNRQPAKDRVQMVALIVATVAIVVAMIMRLKFG